jgi:hypothetical protein
MQWKGYKDTNKRGEVIWKEWKETAFHSWQTDIDWWDNQNIDGETKIVLGFIGISTNGLIQRGWCWSL